MQIDEPCGPYSAASRSCTALRRARSIDAVYKVPPRHIRLMTDAEAHEWFVQARVRQMTPCCLCSCDAYTRDTACYMPGDTVVQIPSCENEDHAVCPACTASIVSAHVQTHGLDAPPRIACPFPFGSRRCTGSLRLPQQHLARAKQAMQSIQMPATCPACHACRSYRPHDSYAVQCSDCDAHFCMRCESGECVCDAGQQPPSGWSRHFRDAQGRPLRYREVTASLRQETLRTALEAGGQAGGHVACPTCSVRLHKTSACNELRHCKGSVVCYACGAMAYPWEKALPSSHWDSCPRWDAEDAAARAAGFQCRDGECATNEAGECVEAHHARGVEAYHVVRLRRYQSHIQVS
jgi:hypothetical protein